SVPGAEGVRKELLAEMLPYYQDFTHEAAEEPAASSDLALTYSKIGYLFDQLGSQPEAEQAYQDARTILEKLVAKEPGDDESRRHLALCCNNLGQLLEKRGAVEAAREQLERALNIQQRLVDASTGSTE